MMPTKNSGMGAQSRSPGTPPRGAARRRLSKVPLRLLVVTASIFLMGACSFYVGNDEQVVIAKGTSGLVNVGNNDNPVNRQLACEILDSTGALDARIDPTGQRVSFAREGELFVVDLGGGDPRQLSSGAEDGLTNGVADFIAAEELERTDGHWWSPQGDRIAYVRADSRHIPNYAIVHQGKDEVVVENHRYPFAGEANAFVELAVVEVETGSTVWMELGAEKDIYLSRVQWRPDGVLTAQVLSRDQTTISLLAFDAAGAATTLIEVTGDRWINVYQGSRLLESGEIL